MDDGFSLARHSWPVGWHALLTSVVPPLPSQDGSQHFLHLKLSSTLRKVLLWGKPACSIYVQPLEHYKHPCHSWWKGQEETGDSAWWVPWVRIFVWERKTELSLRLWPQVGSPQSMSIWAAQVWLSRSSDRRAGGDHRRENGESHKIKIHHMQAWNSQRLNKNIILNDTAFLIVQLYWGISSLCLLGVCWG